ncbi:MAG: site-specific integrase [Actinomycetia bacterium]|nr:site-specific integrase [Actinomycetes bacterium]
MAQRPTVRWNEGKQRWMAWVRFPDGSRRKVERVDKADAQTGLDALLTLRAQAEDPEPPRRRMATFAEVIEAWFADGCPNVAPSRSSRHARVKSPNTIANARQLLGTSVIPVIGSLKVDRTTTRRLEELFESMVATHATSTIDRNWNYLNQALQHGQRNRTISTDPAADVLLPAKRPSKPRRSFTLEQTRALITEAIPADPRPAMWLTGLMCGLRPGELAGLRWPYLDIDSDSPAIEIAEAAIEVDDRYVGQGSPKTARSRRRIALHPLLVAALQRHRDEQRLLGLYDDEAIVFCTRNGTPMTKSNMRRAFQQLCKNAGLGEDWTTYELRHSFVSLVSDQLDDLVKVADLAGHVDTRTTEGYRHNVRPSLPHAVEAWDQFLESPGSAGDRPARSD